MSGGRPAGDAGSNARSDEPVDRDVLTNDRRIVRLRSIGPDDRAGLAALYERASVRSRYLRFFSAGVSISPEIARLTRAHDSGHRVVVAEHAGTIIAVASYERLSAEQAEIAILVDDRWQGHGVGTLLIEMLAAEARHVGISELVGDVLVSNRPMLGVTAALGPVVPRPTGADRGVLQILIPTLPGAAAVEASLSRERAAERQSLRPLFTPSAVAVVGASRNRGAVGHEVVRALKAAGFHGRIYPVNPAADSIAGLPAAESVQAIGEPVDLAVIAVPPAAVQTVVAECAAAGVGAAIVLTATIPGAETDPADSVARMVQNARAAGMRLVGPNCIGVINTDPEVCLAATFAASRPAAGHLAVASQSGAVGIAILEAATRAGIGISSFVSLGNKADVSSNDLLSYWYDDISTEAIAMYVESFGNPRRFAQLARAVARRKPVLVVKSARSKSGGRAGASHTAAAAAPDIAVDALLAQAGVIRCDTLGDLLDTARVITGQPLPLGDRVAVIGNAGGLNILTADAAEAANLAVTPLPAAVQQQLAAHARHPAGVDNPVDLGADVEPDTLASAIRAVAASGAADAFVVTCVATLNNDITALLAAVAEAADVVSVPIVTIAVGLSDPPPSLGRRKVPVFPRPEEAVRALGRAWWYAAWQQSNPGGRTALSGIDSQRARSVVAAALTEGGGWQPPAVANALLADYGIAVLRCGFAADPDEAARVAADVGFPVVIKAADPSIVHKSDVGAVILDVGNQHGVRKAYGSIARGVGIAQPVVLIQPMAPSGVELVAGVVHDHDFGSLIMLGLGGIHTDLLDDRSFRLLPLLDADASTMWHSLKTAPLLTGYRGSTAANTAAVEDLMLRIGQLAEDHPEVAELDLNPVIATANGVVVVDVKMRLARVGGEPDAYLPGLSMRRS